MGESIWLFITGYCWLYQYVLRGIAYSLRWWIGVFASVLLVALDIGSAWLIGLTIINDDLVLWGKLLIVGILVAIMVGITMILYRWCDLLYQLTQQKDESGRLVAKPAQETA
ncbi:hypothetical protein [uncultured Leuconostoc sp.]|uniref:hypothetical protein n=1 Tax=uncultured Leuconostoc sp. TaxID=173262 RepID=UPI0025FB1FDD|nr:hypothetical protein [uncultured Leuconostoc sp.]